MIFVTLGTQDKSFERLLEYLDELCGERVIDANILVQSGVTKYHSDNMQIRSYFSSEEFDSLVEKSDIIITHGGAGSMLAAMKSGKKVIAVPRKSEYGEHVDNHQEELVNKFSKEGFIMAANNLMELRDAIIASNNFEPKEYKDTSAKVINKINEIVKGI